MKNSLKILIMALCFGSITAIVSCSKDEVNCTNKTFNSFAECDKETNDVDCICVQDGSVWKAVPNP
jgi:hypothetical protein